MVSQHAFLDVIGSRCGRPGCGQPQSSPNHSNPRPILKDLILDEPVFSAAGRPVHATDTIPAVQAWDAFTAQVRDLIIKKSAGYGDAWQQQGYMGNLARILSKAARLENMLWRDYTLETAQIDGGEAAMDTLQDLGALCAFMIANLDEGNRWGRQ